MIKPHWTPANDVRLAELRAARFTIAEIAQRLGFSPSWIEQRVHALGLQKKAANGTGKPRRKPAATPAQSASRLSYGTDFSCPACDRGNRPLVGSRQKAGVRVCGECASGGPKPACVAQPAKVTVCPGYPGYDVRYALPPDAQVPRTFELPCKTTGQGAR